MLPFHRRLAEAALSAVESYGFVLGGGYAISENGIGQRPSSDVDLFTIVNDPVKFAEAVDITRHALTGAV